MSVNSNPENKENDEKMIYARKSQPKENTKKSKKSVVGEKGTTSGKKSIDELMSEVVMSCGKFFCPENCGKSFGTKNPIKKHLLSHRPQSEWPFVCLFCGKYFQVRLISNQTCKKKVSSTGKSLSEALIFASINPQHDNRLFVELP